MKIDPERFRALLQELAEENPLACRGLLGIAGVEFTNEVATAAVTLGARPLLRVNLEFVERHCLQETDVKALLVHEFLHVLLRHTLEIRRLSRGVNLALDATINALIHRKLGAEYSAFMSRYYATAVGPMILLRPPEPGDFWLDFEEEDLPPEAAGTVASVRLASLRWLAAEGIDLWRSLYAGLALHEDVLEFLKGKALEAQREPIGEGQPVFLGNHDADVELDADDLPPGLASRLRETARELAAQGALPGAGMPKPGDLSVPPVATEEVRLWERLTLQLLRRLIVPHARAGLQDPQPRTLHLPVLNAADRRGVLRSLWNPLVPDIGWATHRLQPRGSVAVYLDVSGSMNAELKAIVALLRRFERYLRRPFHAFGTTVERAEFRNGSLVTRSTGGTSMACVLAHLKKHRPEKALVITDGFVERLPAAAYAQTGTQVEILLTANGTEEVLEPSGWSLHRLPARG